MEEISREAEQNFLEMMAIWSKKVSKLEDLRVPEGWNRSMEERKLLKPGFPEPEDMS